MSRTIKKGSTDRSAYIRVLDSTTFIPETGFAYNTSGIDLWYRRQGGAKVSITEATLATIDAAHSDGGVIHIGDGYVRVDLPDAAFATGANDLIVGGTATDLVIQGELITLVDYDPADGVRLGLSALPNAAVNATGGIGGLVIRGATAQAGAASTITLDASASAVDDFYNGTKVRIVSGTGVGQERQIIDYVGSTKVATIYAAGPPVQGAQWATTPDNTSVFEVMPESVVPAAVTIGSLGVVDANITRIDGQTVSAGGAVAFPNATLASTTNITGGTITTTTNLTNLPTMPTDWVTSAGLSAGAVTEIQSGLATAAALTTVDDLLDTEIAAIKAKTDSLTFTVAGKVDSNTLALNGTTLVGNGVSPKFGV